MAERKPFKSDVVASQSLLDALERSRMVQVTDDMLRQQRVSFAFGNALGDEKITKESVMAASQTIRVSG